MTDDEVERMNKVLAAIDDEAMPLTAEDLHEAMAMGLFPLEAPRYAEEPFAQYLQEAVRDEEDKRAGALEMSVVLRTLEERLARRLRERGQAK